MFLNLCSPFSVHPSSRKTLSRKPSSEPCIRELNEISFVIEHTRLPRKGPISNFVRIMHIFTNL